MDLKENSNMAKIRTLGFFTKGMVYLLVGSLTFMAAFNWGGRISSSNNVISFLMELPLGKALVGIVSLGLLAYSLWRFYEVILTQRNNKDDKLKSGFKMFRGIFIQEYFTSP
jgi:hypothetical protein